MSTQYYMFFLKEGVLLTLYLLLSVSTLCFGSTEVKKTGLKIDGAFLKVVLKYDKVPILKEPYVFSEIVVRAPRFNFFYVFPTELVSKKTMTGYYKIGKTPYEKDILGWVHEDDLFEWKTRETVRFTPTENRPSARLYATERNLTKVIKAKNPYLYYPISEEFEDTSSKKFHLLIPVNQKKIRRIEKKKYTFYELTYLHSGSFESAYLPAEGFGVEKDESRAGKVNIVFVVDTTRSIRSYLEGIKNFISLISEKIVELPQVKKVQIGIVEYRDYPIRYPVETLDSRKFKKIFKFVTRRTLPLTEDLETIRSILQDIKTLDATTFDFEEAFYDGIWSAVDKTEWHASALKLIVIFSDSGGHSTRSRKNPFQYSSRNILKETEKKGITFIAVKLLNNTPGVKIKEDQKKSKKEMKKLAKGRRGKNKGEYVEVSSMEESSKKLEELIINLIASRLSKKDKLKKKYERESPEQKILSLIQEKGGTKEALLFLIRNEQAIDEEVVESKSEVKDLVVQDYEVTMVAHNVSPFLRKEKVKDVELAKGWIVEKQEEYQFVKSYTLLTKQEVDILVFFLKTAERYTKIPSRDNWAKANMFFKRRIGRKILKSDNLKEKVFESMNVPVFSDLLSFSFFDLLGMKVAERRNLARKMKKTRKALKESLYDQSKWIPITDTYSIQFFPTDLLP